MPRIFTGILSVTSKSLPGNYCSSRPQREFECKRIYALLRLTSKSHADNLNTILNLNLVFRTQDFFDLTSVL